MTVVFMCVRVCGMMTSEEKAVQMRIIFMFFFFLFSTTIGATIYLTFAFRCIACSGRTVFDTHRDCSHCNKWNATQHIFTYALAYMCLRIGCKNMELFFMILFLDSNWIFRYRYSSAVKLKTCFWMISVDYSVQNNGKTSRTEICICVMVISSVNSRRTQT